jgi:hypothetical protein
MQPSYWIYVPVKGASIAFAILFLISGSLHIWQNVLKYRSWRIGFLFPWAAALFVAGFCLREYGAYHPFDTDPNSKNNLAIFIASTVMLFVAPPVYSGALYFIFGRILYYLPYLSPMHPGRVWTTFIALDLVVGIIAGNGASYASNSSNTPSQIKLGFNLAKASLILQLVMFLAFVSLIAIFHRRCITAQLFNARTKTIISLLYTSSLLILLRNTFRTATFFYSPLSPCNRTEAFFWVFEATPMLINTYMMNVFPPAKYMPANHKIYLAKDGKTELEGPGMVDKRPFLLSLFDPFDLVGVIMKRDSKNRFWERDGIGGPREDGSWVDGHGGKKGEAVEEVNEV